MLSHTNYGATIRVDLFHALRREVRLYPAISWTPTARTGSLFLGGVYNFLVAVEYMLFNHAIGRSAVWSFRCSVEERTLVGRTSYLIEQEGLIVIRTAMHRKLTSKDGQSSILGLRRRSQAGNTAPCTTAT